MKRRGGKLRAEIYLRDVYSFKELFGFAQIGAPAEYPRDKFKGRDVVLALGLRLVIGICREIKPGHGKALFVGAVVIKGVALENIGHAYHRVVRLYLAGAAKAERKVSRSDGDSLVI